MRVSKLFITWALTGVVVTFLLSLTLGMELRWAALICFPFALIPLSKELMEIIGNLRKTEDET